MRCGENKLIAKIDRAADIASPEFLWNFVHTWIVTVEDDNAWEFLLAFLERDLVAKPQHIPTHAQNISDDQGS